ncbi:MAG: hypothetical protein ACFE8G_12970 [Candidatus Hermodarchaeota archaeon]
MVKYEVKPNYANENEINKAIGKILWGKEGKKYSLMRLFLALIKKRKGGKNKNES